MVNLLQAANSWWNRYRRALYSCCVAALGGFGLGTGIGYSTDIIPDLKSTSDIYLSDLSVALVVSLLSVGGFFGGPLGGIVLDKIGRKLTLMATTLPLVFGWLIIVSSKSVYCLCVGRFLTGISLGVMDVAVPVYITEISSASVRGFMGTCYELFANLGILYVFAFGTFLHWNWLAVACQAIPALMIVCMLFVPESPRWLMKVGRKEECLKTLKWLRGADEDINLEMSELEESVKAVQLSQSEWKEFLSPSVYRPLFVVMGLMLFQQMIGSNVMAQYMVSILQAAGSKWDPFSLTAIIGAAGVVANVLSAVIVDRVGRRVMLLVSISLMTLCLSCFSIYFTLSEFYFKINISENYSEISFVCILVYTISFALGFGPIPFYLAGEILPLKVRGKAYGMANCSIWFFNFLTCFTFPYLVNVFGYYGTFWLMTGFGLFSFAFVCIFVRETKGMSLEAIEKLY